MGIGLTGWFIRPRIAANKPKWETNGSHIGKLDSNRQETLLRVEVVDKPESDHPATRRDRATILAWVSIAIFVSFLFSRPTIYRSVLLLREGLSLHAEAWTIAFFYRYFWVIFGVSVFGVVAGFMAKATLRKRTKGIGMPLRIPLWLSTWGGCVLIVLNYIACPVYIGSTLQFYIGSTMHELVFPGFTGDMRAVAIAIEAYHEDHGVNPPQLLPYLTTPTAYIDHVPYDPMYLEKLDLYVYKTYGRRWILISAGPNGEVELDPEKDYRDQPEFSIWTDPDGRPKRYDPTNGSFSGGDYYWTMEWVRR